MNWIPYFAVCALLWFSAWGISFWYYRSRQQHGPLLKRLSWPGRLLLLTALAAIPVGYVYSHAGYQQLLAAFPDQRSWLGPMADLYIPMQFLTLLQNGTLDWSFEPFLYPAAVVPVVVVPYLIHRITLSTHIRHPRTVGLVVVGLLAITCFVFMLGPV